jgi:hypothetical protein
MRSQSPSITHRRSQTDCVVIRAIVCGVLSQEPLSVANVESAVEEDRRGPLEVKGALVRGQSENDRTLTLEDIPVAYIAPNP